MSVSRETILSEFVNILKDQLGLDKDFQVQEDHHIEDDLGGDSLDVVSLVLVVDEVFNSNVIDHPLSHLTTVKDVVDHIHGILNSK